MILIYVLKYVDSWKGALLRYELLKKLDPISVV